MGTVEGDFDDYGRIGPDRHGGGHDGLELRRGELTHDREAWRRGSSSRAARRSSLDERTGAMELYRRAMQQVQVDGGWWGMMRGRGEKVERVIGVGGRCWTDGAAGAGTLMYAPVAA